MSLGERTFARLARTSEEATRALGLTSRGARRAPGKTGQLMKHVRAKIT